MSALKMTQQFENSLPAPIGLEEQAGYPKLASFMSAYPSTMIFRRFKWISVLNILRLQAELQRMEEDLLDILGEDANSEDPEVRLYCTDFALLREKLREKADDPDLFDAFQIEQLQDVGLKLAEYGRAVDDAARLSGLASPKGHEVNNLRSWFKRPDGGASFLKACESRIWSRDQADLFCLHKQPYSGNVLADLLSGPVLTLWHWTFGRRLKSDRGYHEYSDIKLASSVKVISTTLASVLPTIAVLVLYFVTAQLLRIGLLIVFTTLFSLALSLTTDAKPAEVFVATATFAAVEVVFIGTSGES